MGGETKTAAPSPSLELSVCNLPSSLQADQVTEIRLQAGCERHWKYTLRSSPVDLCLELPHGELQQHRHVSQVERVGQGDELVETCQPEALLPDAVVGEEDAAGSAQERHPQV